MRICFVSRRYWPAVSGMSVYAENLLRELVGLGHEVTMISQYRDDEVGMMIYGGGHHLLTGYRRAYGSWRCPAGVRR